MINNQINSNAMQAGIEMILNEATRSVIECKWKEAIVLLKHYFAQENGIASPKPYVLASFAYRNYGLLPESADIICRGIDKFPDDIDIQLEMLHASRQMPEKLPVEYSNGLPKKIHELYPSLGFIDFSENVREQSTRTACKLLFVIKGSALNRGMNTGFENLAWGLAEKGHEITILSAGNEPKAHQYNVPNGVRYCFTRSGPDDFLRYIYLFQLIALMSSPDVIIAWARYLLRLVSFCPNTFRPYFIVHEGSIQNIDVPKVFWNAENCIDLWVPISGAMKKDIVSLFGVNPGKLNVIYRGVDTSVFNQGSSDKQSSSSFRIIFTGNIEKRKGVIDLIGACRFIDFPLEIILCGRGDQDLIVSLNKELKSYNACHTLIHKGVLSAKEIATEIKEADIFFFASYAEGFGKSLIEAMACGCPPIVSDIPVFLEIITDKQNGLVVKQGDIKSIAEAISLYHGDEGLRQKCSQNARETVDRLFKKEHEITNWCKLLGLVKLTISDRGETFAANKNQTYHGLDKLPSINTVIDIGVGQQGTEFLYQRFADAFFISIDPIPEAKAIVKKRLRPHKNIFIQAAVGNQTGLVNLQYSRVPSRSSIYQRHFHDNSSIPTNILSVRSQRLDSLLKGINILRPCLLKIDIEGGELECMKGGTNTLKAIDYIILELPQTENYIGSYKFSEAIAFLAIHGFEIFQILKFGNNTVDILFARHDDPLRVEFAYGAKNSGPFSFGNLMSKGKPSFNQMLVSLSSSSRDFFFIQIGANDGISNDPLHNFISTLKPRGILIEPQHDAFERLQRTYPLASYPNLSLLNAAVSNQSGYATLYRIKKSFEETYKAIYKPSANPSGISSFHVNHIKSFLLKVAPDFFRGKDLNDYIEDIRVSTLSPQRIVYNNNIDHIDLLVVDAEGEDGPIVREFLKLDDALRPKMIFFESKNISSSEKCRLYSILIKHRYSLYEYGGDMCAVNFSAIRESNMYCSEN